MEEILNRSVRKLRVLTTALIISGALNIGLVSMGIFSSLEKESLSIRPVAKGKSLP